MKQTWFWRFLRLVNNNSKILFQLSSFYSFLELTKHFAKLGGCFPSLTEDTPWVDCFSKPTSVTSKVSKTNNDQIPGWEIKYSEDCRLKFWVLFTSNSHNKLVSIKINNFWQIDLLKIHILLWCNQLKWFFPCCNLLSGGVCSNFITLCSDKGWTHNVTSTKVAPGLLGSIPLMALRMSDSLWWPVKQCSSH